MPEFSNHFPSECSTYLDDDADTVVTTTDVGHGYTDDGALSLRSRSAGSEAEAEGGGRSSSRASHGMTMEEVERATREMLLLANAANAAASSQVGLRPSVTYLSLALTFT